MQWSEEFKEAVSKECARQKKKGTAQQANYLLDILTNGVCKEYIDSFNNIVAQEKADLNNAQYEMCKARQRCERAIEEMQSEKASLEKIKDLPKPMSDVCVFFSTLTAIALRADADPDTAVTEAAYIAWAYLAGDKIIAKEWRRDNENND